MWKFGPKWSVGIDLGSEYIKLVCLAKTSKGFNLISYGMFHRKNSDKIKELLGHPKFKTANLRVSIKESLLKTRKLELPPAPDDDLAQMLKMAMIPHLPSAPENYVLRYQALQKIVLFAEKKQIDEYLLELKSLGIPPVASLEPRMSALAFAVAYNHPPGVNKCTAIVDIGFSAAIFAVVSEEGLTFSRNLSEASESDLFKQIGAHLNVSAEEIASRKQADPEYLTIKNPDTKDVIIAWLYKVAIEIQNSIENYQIQFPGQKVTDLLLTGGASKLPGLSGYIADTLKVPTSFLKAFQRVSTSGFPGIDFESQEHYYATAIGLAL